MGMKAPTIIRAIKDDLAAGKACVIQVVSTGESLLKRRFEAMDPEDELVEGALTPRDYVLGYLEQAFPIHAQKLVEIDGNMVAEPLRDETGALVVSREALALANGCRPHDHGRERQRRGKLLQPDLLLGAAGFRQQPRGKQLCSGDVTCRAVPTQQHLDSRGLHQVICHAPVPGTAGIAAMKRLAHDARER
jgi:hypothetical protein